VFTPQRLYWTVYLSAFDSSEAEAFLDKFTASGLPTPAMALQQHPNHQLKIRRDLALRIQSDDDMPA
jgi:hypothetical protein